MTLLTVAVVLGGVNVALLCLLIGRRMQTSVQERRRDRIRARLKPHVFQFLGGDGEPPPGLSPLEQSLLAELLDGYARLLSGTAHARIVSYFERHGMIDRDLVTLRRHRKASHRAAAAYRLGDVGPARVVPALVRALADADRDVRVAAARSLGRLARPEAAATLFAAIADARLPGLLARWALLQLGSAIVPQLRDLTTAPSAGIRASATELLGLLGSAPDTPVLAARLADPAAQVRVRAAAALARLGDGECVPGLVAALADQSPAVRAAAAEALGRLRDPRAADALRAGTRSGEFQVAVAAAYALAAIDPPAARREAFGCVMLAEAVDIAALR